MSKVMLVCMALVAMAGCKKDPAKPVLVTNHDGGSSKPPLFGPSAPDANPADVTGAMLYGKLCAQCHGPEALGNAADNAPSLRSETFLATATDDFLAHSIRDGRPGSSMGGYGKARGGPLNDEAVAKIIEFIRGGATAPVALAPQPSKGDAKAGQATYDKVCAACHGTPAQRGIAVHLSNATFLQVATDEFLRHAIVQGRPGTKMLPMGGAKLDATQIEDVIALIRSWQTAAPIAPDAEPKAPRPKDTQIVLNEGGGAPKFDVKDDRFIGAKQIADALADGKRMIIVDARPTSEWAAQRIKGALSIPYYEPELLDDIPEKVRKDTWLLAYCACPHHLSGEIVDAAKQRGFEKAAVIDEGINFWAQAGYPVEGTGAKPHDHAHDHAHDHPPAKKETTP